MSDRLQTIVIKLGGKSLEAKGATDALVRDLASSHRPKVIVHGGGAEVSDWCKRLGLTPRFEDGLRVTDEATMEVAAAVLAGLANKRLVAALGSKAVGLSALDGGIVEAAPHPDSGRLGSVASVRKVQTALLSHLLRDGRLPVLASIAAIDGKLFNINADDLAGALAGSLMAETLVLLSDAPGLILDGKVVPRVAADEIDRALARPEVEGGMRPKLRAAKTALAGGVSRVVIAAWNGPGTLRALLDGTGMGTTLEAGAKPVHN